MASRIMEIHKDKGQNGYDIDVSRTEINTLGDRDREPASVLLEDVTDIIRVTGGVVDRLGNTLTFHAGSGRTVVEVRDIQATTIGKQEVSNVVLIRTELPNYPMEPREMAAMTRWPHSGQWYMKEIRNGSAS